MTEEIKNLNEALEDNVDKDFEKLLDKELENFNSKGVLKDFLRSVAHSYIGFYSSSNAFDAELYKDQLLSKYESEDFDSDDGDFEGILLAATRDLFFKDLSNNIKNESLRFIPGFKDIYVALLKSGFVGSEADLEASLRKSKIIRDSVEEVSYDPWS